MIGEGEVGVKWKRTLGHDSAGHHIGHIAVATVDLLEDRTEVTDKIRVLGTCEYLTAKQQQMVFLESLPQCLDLLASQGVS